MKLFLNKKAFSLVELLVVIGILGILVAIAIPSYTSYQIRTKKVKFLSNIQEVLFDMQTCLNIEPNWRDCESILTPTAIPTNIYIQRLPYTASRCFNLGLDVDKKSTLTGSRTSYGNVDHWACLSFHDDGTANATKNVENLGASRLCSSSGCR